MGAISLVEKDIEKGRKLIELLDKNNFPVSAAVWVYHNVIDRWTLLIATPKYKKITKGNVRGGMQADREFLSIIRDDGEKKYEFENNFIQLVPVDDPIIKAFEEKVGPVDRTGGIRSTITRVESAFVSEFIEDALVYRIAA